MVIVTTAAGVGALVVACGAPASTVSDSPAQSPKATASKTPAPTPTKPKPSATTPSHPTTVKKTVVEYRTIPFKKKTVTDSSLPEGEKVITTRGVNGTRRLTYEVTYVNGVQTSKRLVRSEVSKPPRTQVTAVGTKTEKPSGCDPNYSGACVPIASDVDCSGGSGNGPAYVRGPVTVVGKDIYDLDSDNDGIGCED